MLTQFVSGMQLISWTFFAAHCLDSLVLAHLRREESHCFRLLLEKKRLEKGCNTNYHQEMWR